MDWYEWRDFLSCNPCQIQKSDLWLFGTYEDGELEFPENYFQVLVNYMNENYVAWNIRKFGETYLARIS